MPTNNPPQQPVSPRSPMQQIPKQHVGNLAHYRVTLPDGTKAPLRTLAADFSPKPQEEAEGSEKPSEAEIFGKGLDEAVEMTKEGEGEGDDWKDVLDQVDGLDGSPPGAEDTEGGSETALPSVQQAPAMTPTSEASQAAPGQQKKERHVGAYLAGRTTGALAKHRIKKGLDREEEGQGEQDREGDDSKERPERGGNVGKMSKRQRSIKLAKAAALRGAVEGLAQGDIKKAAWLAACYYWLDIMFGILLAVSETVIGSVLALLYLDFHYFMSKTGSRLFCEMSFTHKVFLVLANLFVVAIMLFAIIILVAGWCFFTTSTFSTIWQILRGNFINYCVGKMS